MKAKAFRTMLKVELKLSVRDMNMIFFAVGMPFVITLILGFVYGAKPAFEGAAYTAFEQSFGAMASIGILAAGVMGLPLVLSDYRDKKILKRYQCTPTSPGFLFIVQIIKYSIYSIGSALIVYAVAACFGYRMNGNVFAFIGGFILILIAIYSMGMLVAALAPSSQKAGLICALLYFPMLIFSGTTLPYEIMPRGLQIFSDCLPMTQGIKLLTNISLGLPFSESIIPLIVMLAITVVCTIISIRFFKWSK